MNLYIRVLIVLLSFWLKDKKKIVGPLVPSSIPLRVWPLDLDCNMHMNNGRYLTIMDLGRLDLILRSGLSKAARSGHWVPILSLAGIRYRMELRAFQRYDLETRILGWDAEWFVIEQRFIIRGGERDGACAAIALVKGAFYDRTAKALIHSDAIMQELEFQDPSPTLPDYAKNWLAASDGLREATANDTKRA